MDKKLSLKIGEKEVSLNFGVNVFFEFYKEESNHDLVKDPGLKLLDLDSTDIFSYLQNMIWSGYRASCYISKTEPELSKEDVRYFVMSSTEDQASSLLWEIHACTAGKTVEELKELAITASEKKNQLEPTGMT